MPWAPKPRRRRTVKKRDRRPSAARRGYGHRWRRYRAAFLRRNPLCRRCLRKGITAAACEVDHVRPVSGPDDPLFWKPSNHQALCKPCHSRKTQAEDKGRGRG